MSATGQPFVHLRVHSAYSLLEGALTIGKLAEHVRDARAIVGPGMKAPVKAVA